VAEPAHELDVIVVGGGPVGAAAALGLAGAGFDVGILEKSEPRRQVGRLGFDPRTIALNPATRELLERLGAWGRFETCPYRTVYVWEDTGTRHIEFTAEEMHREDLGAIAEVSAVLVALWEALRETGRVRMFTDTQIDDVEPGPDRVRLAAGGRTFAARLLIAADGGQSFVRRVLGVATSRLATHHTALATVVRTERFHEGAASQRFLAEGPLALLPLPARDDEFFCSVVWSSLPERTRELAAKSDRDFAQALEAASERRLGAVLDVDQRHEFPLEQAVAESFNPYPRVLLVGDAARVLHPLAGQGVNHGFEDVRDIVALAGRLAPGDPGAPGVWARFDAERRLRAALMVRAMDAFRRVYAVDEPVFRWLRNTGVAMLDRNRLVKTGLVRRALGL